MAVAVVEVGDHMSRSRRILSSSGLRSVVLAVVSILLILVALPLVLVAAGT